MNNPYDEMFCHLIGSKLDDYKKYYDRIEKYFETELLSPEYDNASPEELIENDFLNLISTYPNYIRMSIVIQIISAIEIDLKRLCDIHRSRKKEPYSISDLNGTDLEKCKKYLVRSVKIDFGKYNDKWSFILTVNKIRNRLIHQSGMIALKDIDAEMRKMEAEQLIMFHKTQIDNEYIIQLIPTFCDKLIDVSKTFLVDVYKETLQLSMS